MSGQRLLGGRGTRYQNSDTEPVYKLHPKISMSESYTDPHSSCIAPSRSWEDTTAVSMKDTRWQNDTLEKIQPIWTSLFTRTRFCTSCWIGTHLQLVQISSDAGILDPTHYSCSVWSQGWLMILTKVFLPKRVPESSYEMGVDRRGQRN